MNLPNKLTILRILMIPVCILFVVLGWYTVAGIVFIIAAVTDFLDGYIARKQNIIIIFNKPSVIFGKRLAAAYYVFNRNLI